MRGSNIASFPFSDRLNHKIFLYFPFNEFVLYNFELQMAGVILLTAMAVGGISLWIKKRRERRLVEYASDTDESQNF